MPSYQNEHRWGNSYYEPKPSRKDVIKTLGNRFPLKDREKNWAKHYLNDMPKTQKKPPTRGWGI